MHKDKPPGLFEFGARPASHAVTFGLATGAVLSILIYIGISLWGADVAARWAPQPGAEGLERDTAALRNDGGPKESPAVRY